MSKTTVLTVGDRGFWALNDAFGVWLAYLAEEIEGDAAEAQWLAEIAEQMRVSAAITDLGFDLDPGPADQVARIRSYAASARRAAVGAVDVPVGRLRRWMILPDVAVAGGFSRTGPVVELQRILEVADAFIAILDGDFPPDPAAGAWFTGTGAGMLIMKYHSPPGPGESRFRRGS